MTFKLIQALVKVNRRKDTTDRGVKSTIKVVISVVNQQNISHLKCTRTQSKASLISYIERRLSCACMQPSNANASSRVVFNIYTLFGR